MKKFLPEWWNVNGLNEDIINRTNNPSNGTIVPSTTPHPDVVKFIAVIKEQSRENVRLINDISNRRASAPAHAAARPAPGFESDPDLYVDSDSDLEVDSV